MGSCNNIFFVLFLAFAIAAITWLLLCLFGWDSGEYSVRSGVEDDSSASADEEPDRSDDDEESSWDSGYSEDDSAEDQVEAAAVDNGDEDSSDQDSSKDADSSDSDDADDSEGEDNFEAATEAQAAKLFASKLEDGSVTEDPVYGIIYKEAPSKIEDIKEIRGVAKALEGKLNEIGVHRFKQVAVWIDAACAKFLKLLTFKNRIYTDNWFGQAKGFHEKK